MEGYVYVMDNPAFRTLPSKDLSTARYLFKIGCTTKHPHRRAEELYTTGLPFPFEVIWYRQVTDIKAYEKFFHKMLSNVRCNERREFFWLNVDGIHEYLDDLCDHASTWLDREDDLDF